MHPGSRQAGVTLIEILITVVILAIGMLGVMSVELFAIRMNQEAYQRTQAMLQAQELADRMHANPVGTDSEAYAGTIAASNSPPDPVCVDLPDLGLTGEACTPAQLAAFDLWEWNKGCEDYLPGGQGTVTYSDVTEAHTITVSWLEKEQEGVTGTERKNFTFVYKPLPLSLNINPD